jgi:hypothetical protein
MRRTTKIHIASRQLPYLRSYRPTVELLEDRLPPGDVFMGGSLMGSRLGGNASVLAAGSLSVVNSFGVEGIGASNSLVASASAQILAASQFSWQDLRTSTPAQIGRRAKGGPITRKPTIPLARGKAAMGIDWMTRDELSQAVPTAYTEHIGRQLLK